LRHAVAYLVETICYKLEGRRFDEVIGYFNWPNPSSRRSR
jgi:hypothetical protein